MCYEDSHTVVYACCLFTNYYQYYENNFFNLFSSNSEAKASKLLEKILKKSSVLIVCRGHKQITEFKMAQNHTNLKG